MSGSNFVKQFLETKTGQTTKQYLNQYKIIKTPKAVDNHNETWKKINSIVGKAYKNQDTTTITNRFYNANSNWESIAKIVNTLPKPIHYANKNTVIQRILEAKGKTLSSEKSSNNSNSESGGGSENGVSFGNDGSENSNDSNSKTQEGSAENNEDLTFEDIISSIASAIDAHWYIVNDKVYFNSFDVLFASGYEKTGFPEVPIIIDYWMQEDGSLELDLNQYGFYNTVYVEYKHGVVKATNDDLVRVYDEVPITYSEPTLGYYEAQLKAQAYLSAHIRDFNMEIKVSTLYTGKIKVGSFIKLRNPLTMSENLYYVYGMSVSWDAGENTFIADLDLRFGPENPDNPEIPEVGMSYTNSGSTSILSDTAGEICSLAQKVTANATTIDEKIEAWWNYWKANMHYSGYFNRRCSNSSQVMQKRGVNCADGTMAMTDALQCIGAQVKIKHCSNCVFTSGKSVGHYYNEVLYKGDWIIIDSASRYNGWGGHNMKSKSGCHYEVSTAGIA